MLQNLAIIHRRKPRTFASTEVPVWSTCLRSLAFSNGGSTNDIALLPGDELFTQQQAYQFLLEIICGLHSPILGETEVLGQFKIFAQQWCERDPSRTPMVQRLLNDAKSLRAEHLSHLGTQSYGSWLRKNLRSSKIHVVGAGNLAQEILPYLAKRAEVVVHARRPHNVDFHNAKLPLDAHGFDQGALVIAAPMSSREIRAWLNGKEPQQIFDLRETSSADPVSLTAVPLAQIFGDIEQTKVRLLPVVERIKSEILARSEQLAAQEKVRPQGWDDLCA